MTEEYKQCIYNIVTKLAQEEATRIEIEEFLFQFLSSDKEIQKELYEAKIEEKIKKSEVVIEELLTLIEISDYWEKLVNEVEEMVELDIVVKRLFKVCFRKQIRLEILLEEPSMENFFKIILPKVLPEGYELDVNCFLHAHQGKTDLQKSLSTKVKAYQYFPQKVQLVVVHDQDSNDCKVLKQGLIDSIRAENVDQSYLVRIACRELENWYLGDMQAIEAVYPSFKAVKHQNRAKYRNPDNVFGAFELKQMIDQFSKGYASKNIPLHMNINKNNSTSFNHLINGLQYFLTQNLIT